VSGTTSPAVAQSNERRRSVPPSPELPSWRKSNRPPPPPALRQLLYAAACKSQLHMRQHQHAADSTSHCPRHFLYPRLRGVVDYWQQDASAVVNTTFVPTVGSGAPSSFAVTQAAANEAPRISGGRESTVSQHHAIDAVETVPDGIQVEQLSRQLSPQAPPGPPYAASRFFRHDRPQLAERVLTSRLLPA